MALLHEEHRPTICVDVDGVIADYSGGWQGVDHIGEPLPGAREFLQKLRDDGWKIIIHTTRGTLQIWRYLEKWELPYDEINDNSDLRGLNPGKPIASVYLDDRAVTFRGNYDEALGVVNSFKVWYDAH